MDSRLEGVAHSTTVFGIGCIATDSCRVLVWQERQVKYEGKTHGEAHQLGFGFHQRISFRESRRIKIPGLEEMEAEEQEAWDINRQCGRIEVETKPREESAPTLLAEDRDSFSVAPRLFVGPIVRTACPRERDRPK